MKIYECKYCNFKTPNKNNYEKHLSTNKHIRNQEQYIKEEINNDIKKDSIPTNDTKKDSFSSKKIRQNHIFVTRSSSG